MGRRPHAIAAAALTLTLALAATALARPGGGESFSGGGGHQQTGGGGSGGGGGGGALVFELVFQLLRLCVYYPSIGLPVLVVLVAAVVWHSYKSHRDRDWNSGPPIALEPARETAPVDVVRIDPDFSWILFEDFVLRLHAAAHRARGGALDDLAPYLSADARAALLAMPPGGPVPVASVVLGAQRVTRSAIGDDAVHLDVEIESNVTAGARGGQPHTFYLVERWRFTRAASVRTRPPATRMFPCPNCGAPWQAADSAGGQRCASCGQVVDNGRFDWQATAIQLAHADPRPPTLTDEVPERGTDLPSYRQPGVSERWRALLAGDQALTEDGFLARVALAHRELNAAWSRGDLAPVRGLVSDGLFDYLDYWTGTYRAQGLRNVLDGVALTGREICKVGSDRWFHAVTVRIWGQSTDAVIELATDRVLRGSRTRPRRYSEYWTLIRSTSRQGPARGDSACPNCGAPLDVSMAGACTHCGAHLTSGEFDWVLSRIEQDDAYRG